MYKVLLCWRYLLTRYLALACIISVMLGVATLIVVNSVMGGFSSKLQERLHGLLSDVVIEARSLEGFADPEEKMRRIRQDPFLDERIEAMAATIEVFAMIQFEVQLLTGPEMMTRPIRLIGVEPRSRATLGGFKEHLLRQKNSASPSFQVPPEALARYRIFNQFARKQPEPLFLDPVKPGAPPEMHKPGAAADAPKPASTDSSRLPPPVAPPAEEKAPRGAIVGNLIASIRVPTKDPKDPVAERYLLDPGDEVIITTVSGGGQLAPVYDSFLVVDYFKSEMSEYDANYVFVPLDHLQKLRHMGNRVSAIQIKLKNYDRDKKEVVERLQKLFPAGSFLVSTWEEKQGPLLAAIQIEKGILNVLLFLIICVAGFGILAIFSMIVTEKTRDIGILKALGASNRGVMGIFLGYGLLLGVVGALLGTLLGITLTNYINEVEQFLSRLTGHEVFNKSVYYFNEIPTEISPMGVALVNLGSILIAVFFSVLPALRAAMLHPVRALRYE